MMSLAGLPLSLCICASAVFAKGQKKDTVRTIDTFLAAILKRKQNGEKKETSISNSVSEKKPSSLSPSSVPLRLGQWRGEKTAAWFLKTFLSNSFGF